MRRNTLHLVLGVVSLILLVGSILVVGVLHPQQPVRAVASSDDWTMYLHDLGGSGFNSAETVINPSSAASLKLLWSVNQGSIISTQPVVANGLIYWGSWDGLEHATNLDGTQAWTANLGLVTSPTCGTGGLYSSATVATVAINGTATSVLFVGGGDTQFYALNASTGAVIWHTPIGAPPNNVIWSSPVFYNGSVYTSTASLCDNPLTQGQVFRLDAATGAVQNTFNVVANGCGGGGVWGSMTIDSSNGTMYFATGTISSCAQPETMAYAIVQLNASTLALMGSWQVPAAQLGPDSDFGSTPTLFPASIGGTVHQLVGVANKNGIYYAFDEANISAGPVWTAQIAVGGPGPESGDGSISPSAWDGTTLYVGGGNTTIGGQSCQGGLRALNPASGAFIWERCMTDGPIMGSVTVVPGVVAVGEGTALWLMATSDGHSLFKTWDLSTNSKYYAGPTIANGVVYIANKDGKLYAYWLPPSPTVTPTPTSTITPTPTSTVTPTPTPSPTPGTLPAQDTFQRANQLHWGTASDGQTWGGDANSQSVFSIASNMGQVSGATTTPTAYRAILGSTATDAEVLSSGSMSSFTGTFLGTLLRWTNGNNYYRAYISGTNLVVVKKVNGQISVLKQTPFTATAGTSYTIRFRVVGTTLYAKVWQTSTTEPTNWMLTVTDSSLASGFCGLFIQVETGTTVDVASFLATVPGGSPTPTPTPTATPTSTPTPTPTPTATPTSTPTPTITPTPTLTPTPTPSPTPGTMPAQDTFQRANQLHWGTASDGQTWGGDANSQSVFSIASNMGQVSGATTTPSAYSATLGPSATDAEVLSSGSMSSFTGTFLGALLHRTNGNNYYRAYISGTNLVMVKKVNGQIAVLKQIPFTATAGISYTIRFRVVGTTLYAKVWQTSTTEPTNWMLTVTDSSLASGFCGLYIQVETGTTVDVTSFLATAA